MDDFDLPGFDEKPKNPQIAATLNKLKQQANDTIKIYNPTDEDYVVKWDVRFSGGGFMIPGKNKDIGYGKGIAIHPRYIAIKYLREMTDKLMEKRLVDAVTQENNKRAAAGNPKMNHHEERLNFEMKYRTDDEALRGQIARVIWLGVERRYGMDAIVPEQSERKDPRSVDERILANLERNPGQANPQSADLEVILGGAVPETPLDVAPLQQEVPGGAENPDNTTIDGSTQVDQLLNGVAA